MCNWKDFSSLEAEKRDRARAYVEALRTAQQAHEAEIEFAKRKTHEEWEKRSHQERESRTQVGAVDHARLQRMRNDFDSIYPMTDESARGGRFEVLMNELFSYYASLISLCPYRSFWSVSL